MKNLLFLFIVLALTSCKGCVSSFAERKASVLKVCPKCTFTYEGGYYYAVDTTKQPNIVYKIRFKSGGAHYSASDIDEMTRIN